VGVSMAQWLSGGIGGLLVKLGVLVG
jgi:hypothetical protein